jgi:hypothetical protein
VLIYKVHKSVISRAAKKHVLRFPNLRKKYFKDGFH